MTPRRISPRLERQREQNTVLSNPIADYSHPEPSSPYAHAHAQGQYSAYAPPAPQTYMAVNPASDFNYQYPPGPDFQQQPQQYQHQPHPLAYPQQPFEQPFIPYTSGDLSPASLKRTASASVDEEEPTQQVGQPIGEGVDPFARNADYVEGAMVDGKKMRRKRSKKGEVPLDFAARKYVCPDCDKKFARPYALSVHQLSHSKEKPFACSADNCERSFSVLSNLRRHCKTHGHPLPDNTNAVFAVRGASTHVESSRSVHDQSAR